MPDTVVGHPFLHTFQKRNDVFEVDIPSFSDILFCFHLNLLVSSRNYVYLLII